MSIIWDSKGLKMIQDFYLTDSDIIMSSDELKSNLKLSRKHFLQLRNFVKVNQQEHCFFAMQKD